MGLEDLFTEKVSSENDKNGVGVREFRRILTQIPDDSPPETWTAEVICGIQVRGAASDIFIRDTLPPGNAKEVEQACAFIDGLLEAAKHSTNAMRHHICRHAIKTGVIEGRIISDRRIDIGEFEQEKMNDFFQNMQDEGYRFNFAAIAILAGYTFTNGRLPRNSDEISEYVSRYAKQILDIGVSGGWL